jgi:hypothetical protein
MPQCTKNPPLLDIESRRFQGIILIVKTCEHYALVFSEYKKKLVLEQFFALRCPDQEDEVILSERGVYAASAQDAPHNVSYDHCGSERPTLMRPKGRAPALAAPLPNWSALGITRPTICGVETADASPAQGVPITVAARLVMRRTPAGRYEPPRASPGRADFHVRPESLLKISGLDILP